LDELNSNEIYILWQQGKNINEAIEAYCDDINLNSHPRKSFKRIKKTMDISSGLLGLQQKLNFVSNELEKYQNVVYENLADKIRSGELICIAFDAMNFNEIDSGLPEIQSNPEPYQIDRSNWPPDNIDLEHSSIRKRGNIFANIRIIASAEINAVIAEEIPETTDIPEVKGPGAPSYEKEIDHAYDECLKENELDFKSLKDNELTIQKKVRSLYPAIRGNDGLKYEAIRRAVGERFKRDKKL
jgi:hypothetical protein